MFISSNYFKQAIYAPTRDYYTTMTFIDKLLDSFPYPTVTLIIGKPTWESIRAMHLELNANAASF